MAKAISRTKLSPIHKEPNPTIGVSIPIYNGARFLSIAIESALNQTISPDEILCFVHDCTDESERIAELYSDRCKIVISNEGYSMPEAWNRSILLSSCDYVIMLHADDLLEHNIVEHYKNVIALEVFDVGFTRSYTCSEDGTIDGLNMSESEALIAGEVYLQKTLEGFFAGCSGVCSRKEFFQHNSFNESLHIYTDIEWFIRIGWQGNVIGFPLVGARYRVDSSSTYRTSGLDKTRKDILCWLNSFLDGNINPPDKLKEQYSILLFRKVIWHWCLDLWTLSPSDDCMNSWIEPLEKILLSGKKYCNDSPFSISELFIAKLFLSGRAFRHTSVLFYRCVHIYRFLPAKLKSYFYNVNSKK